LRTTLSSPAIRLSNPYGTATSTLHCPSYQTSTNFLANSLFHFQPDIFGVWLGAVVIERAERTLST